MSLPATDPQTLYEDFLRVASVALVEDLGGLGADDDVTTMATVPENLDGEAVVVAKASGVVCGLRALDATYELIDGRVEVKPERSDADTVEPGVLVVRIAGPVRGILTGERTALNVLGHLSGIATVVRAFVQAAPGVMLVDTRKTIPGLRPLQKYAVRTGGASNHRLGLWDGVLVKDNHIVAAGGVAEATRRAVAATDLEVQVECSSSSDADEALAAGAGSLLLDNLSPSEMRTIVERVRASGRAVTLEASGGVTLEAVADIAASGVDRISVGAFTHSAPALDLSLRLERVWER